MENNFLLKSKWLKNFKLVGLGEMSFDIPLPLPRHSNEIFCVI